MFSEPSQPPISEGAPQDDAFSDSLLCCNNNDPESTESCQLCEQSLICRNCRWHVNEKMACTACHDQIERELDIESRDRPNLLFALGGGILAALAGGLAWAFLAAVSPEGIGYAAIGVGYLTGFGVYLGARGKSATQLPYIAVGCALFGLLLGKYGWAAHAVRILVRQPPMHDISYFDPLLAQILIENISVFISPWDILWVLISLRFAWSASSPKHGLYRWTDKEKRILIALTPAQIQRLRHLREEQTSSGPQKSQPEGLGAAPAPINKQGALAVLAVFLLTKGKLLLSAVAPFLTTFSTMAVSAWVYAWFYGAKFAIGLVLLILIHELGHGFAAKIMGLKVSAPIFIPFFGAVIALKEQLRSTWVEAVVGIGGPLAGTLGGIVTLLLGLVFQSGLFLVLAWITFMMNLFNLIPVFGMDGDRISRPFRPWYWLPGCAFILVLELIWLQLHGSINPLLVFIPLLGSIKGVRFWWKERDAARRINSVRLVDQLDTTEVYCDESSVKPWQRSAAGWAYFALAGLLCALIFCSEYLKPEVQ